MGIRVLFFIVSSLLIASCVPSGGELTGSRDLKWKGENTPKGMAFIPAGAYLKGPNKPDPFKILNNQNRVVSVGAFYMDKHEVTNVIYREFIKYTRDSIAREVMFNEIPIQWQKKLDLSKREIRESLMPDLYQFSEGYNNKLVLNTNKLHYTYYTINLKKAVKGMPSMETHEVGVYPDTLCWVRDHTYSFNEPSTNAYFWHPAYNNYPVVGVSWYQAKAFCYYRSSVKQTYLKSKQQVGVYAYRLPTASEWEYAARGGLHKATFPWGNEQRVEGKIMANYKTQEGDYVVHPISRDVYTVSVGSFSANGFGLYDMAGNVAEWTSSDYYPYDDFTHDLNPEYGLMVQEGGQEKVIKGGSWKDIPYFLANGNQDNAIADSSFSYIGFRCVRSCLPK